jgi:hypothetical protein
MLYTMLQGIQTLAWLPIIGGTIFAFIFFLAAYRTKLTRIYYLSGFSLLLGIVAAWSGLSDFLGVALLSLVIGLVLLAFGILTRLTYLRQSGLKMEQDDGA